MRFPKRKFLTASFAISIVGCGMANNRQSLPLPNADPQPSSVASSWHEQELCDRIPDIRIYPFKGERGVDKTYDAFMGAGDRVVPCLIDKVGDGSKVRDPRQEPGFPDVEVRLGDIAYFLIGDITKLPFTDLLPPGVQAQYKSDGVYAYFKYVEKDSNRKDLKSKLRSWYQQNRFEQSTASHADLVNVAEDTVPG